MNAAGLSLSAVVDQLPIALIWMSTGGEVMFLNALAQAWLDVKPGYSGSQPNAPQWAQLILDGMPFSLEKDVWQPALHSGKSVYGVPAQIILPGKPIRLVLLDLLVTNTNNSSLVLLIQDVTQQHNTEIRMLAQTSRAKLLASLSQSFAESGFLYPEIMQTVANQVGTAMGEACTVHIINEDGTALSLKGWHHSNADQESALRSVLQDHPLAVQEDGKTEAFLQQETLLFSPQDPKTTQDINLPGALQSLLHGAQIECVLSSPLIVAGRMIGSIAVWRSKAQTAFDEEDRHFLRELADRAALAIENARLFAEEVQRNRELNALHDATAALMTTLDIEELLGRILDAAQRAIPTAERGILYLMAPRTGKLEVRAILGFNDPRIRRDGLIQNGIIERTMRDKQPLLISDSSETPGLGGLTEEENNLTRSAIYAPLMLNQDVLGALALSASQPNAFGPSDLRLLISFAATTVVALHNATLHAEVQKIAITDALTGLYNRRGLEELGRHEVDRFNRFGHPLSAIMLDIDHFKRVNDRYGHFVGDQVLRELTDRCRAIIRQVDIFARFGGEEFVVLLPETDLFEAVNIAERLRSAVADQPFHTESGEVTITISLGVTRTGKELHSLFALLDQVDVNLYAAKIKGRNRVEVG